MYVKAAAMLVVGVSTSSLSRPRGRPCRALRLCCRRHQWASIVTMDVFQTEGLEILDEAECRSLLELHHFGRVIVVTSGAAAVFPVNYGVVGGDVGFFTGEGTKLREAARAAMGTF